MIVLSSVVLPTQFRPIRHTTPPAGTLGTRSTAPGFRRRRRSGRGSQARAASAIAVTAPAQVDLHHPLVTLDLIHRPLAEHAALVEHGDGAGDAPHELHVVLDDEHGALLGDTLAAAPRLLRLLVRHARHRLVDEEELGVLH